MTEERFNEIRKRKYAEDRVVYTVFAGDKKATALNIVNDDEWFMAIALLNEVYETKEEAEWYCKMNKSRIEKFEPPMWEDIKNTYGFRFIYYDDIIEFTVNYSTMLDGVEFNTQKIVIRNIDERELLFVEPATKKNYKKACEMVGKLFEGGKE